MHHAVNSTTPLAAAAATNVVDSVGNWFTENSGALVSGLVNILIILLVAVVFRAVMGRVITHGVRRMVRSHQRINQATAKAGNLVTRQATEAEHTGQRQQQRARTVGSVLRSVASSVIFGVAFVMILGEFGINLGPILASAGVLGLAIGFGAQSLVRDFLSGIFMMVEDQYGVGDVIDVGEAVGTVESVTLRITKIRDLNGGLWYVRNGEIMRVCNMNQDWANAVVEIPLDYSVDIAHAERVIETTIDEFAAEEEFRSKILEKPDLSGVIGIGNGSVTVRIIVKVKPGEQWALGRALRGRLKSRFDVEGVRVAYPVLPGNGLGVTKQG